MLMHSFGDLLNKPSKIYAKGDRFYDGLFKRLYLRVLYTYAYSGYNNCKI